MYRSGVSEILISMHFANTVSLSDSNKGLIHESFLFQSKLALRLVRVR